MLIIGMCALLVLAGVAAIVVWVDATLTAPAPTVESRAGEGRSALPLVTDDPADLTLRVPARPI